MSDVIDPAQNPIDSSLQSLDNFTNERADFYEKQEQEKANSLEAASQPPPDEFSDVGDVVRGVAETALQPVLGVGDFASDAVGLVPWLKPVDEWWDNNSYRSTHPGHKLLRDASSIIVPTMLGGGAIVGSAKAATAAMRIPSYAKTLGAIAAYTGVDTSVAMISSHSKKDDNMGAVLNDWLGWDIPWATRASDSPDVRWKKNVLEAAGFAGGVELLGAAFTFGRKAKLFPRDGVADTAIKTRQAKLNQYDDPLTAAVEPRREARTAAQVEEGADALRRDPLGEEGYNPFIHDIGEDAAGRAVNDLEADPLLAKVNHAQIQNNVDTINGRAVSVADESFQKRFRRAVNGDERALALDDLFNRITPNVDAVIAGKKISAEQINRAVDNLTTAIHGKDITIREFEMIVDDMKAVTFGANKFLGEEDWIIASRALKESYEKLFDPNQMRASAMLTQQAADTITDTATAAKMIGETADTSRQMSIIFDKVALLADEVNANQYITNKAQEYRRIKQLGDESVAIDWLRKQGDDFDEYIAYSKAKTNESHEFFKKTAKENPHYYKAFQMLYDKTNGNVDQIHKMHAWAEDKIGLIKKGIYDKNPEVPSIIVQGMQTARINSILMGLSPARAAVGNATLLTVKPISVFAGAAVTGDIDALKRAYQVYGGFSENMKRGFKVMRQEWNNAVQHPEEMMMRGRADLRQAKIEDMEILDEIAEGWRANAENGKLAMYNVAKGLTWWNNQTWTKLGTSALYSIDGFLNSFMASGMARAKAYDYVLENSRGAFKQDDFLDMQRRLYDEAFDSRGVLKDRAAEIASKELALNMDNTVVKKLDAFLEHVPAARGLFLFPRTGINALELSWSFNPMSNLGPAMTRARRVLGAATKEEKLAALVEHGIDANQNADAAFTALRNEYIGRQIMGSTVVMGAGMLALEGSLTGNGPQDAAEKRRLMGMGWQPLSIKNPVTGQWHSYRGYEPFDKLLGLTADVVYQSNRIDQSITEDFFRKTAYSISMNITNSTFLSGFNPIAGLISGDPSAWARFTAQQADQLLIPFRGVRSILNNAVTPQLKDVENDFWAYLQNANKFLFSGNENLQDLVDVYTGRPINTWEHMNASANALLPVFKVNGGMEPWRQWLLSTGWDGLQKMRRNKITKEPLSTKDRYFINNWIANNANLKGQVERLMTEGDGFWNKELAEYARVRGLKSQKELPIKETLIHKELDRIHDEAFDSAWDALEARNEQFTYLGREKVYRNWQLQRGDTRGAAKTQKNVNQLLKQTRNK
tara:strand:- start:6898 stop:10716 length:3819 start_codon:yes stop_codon:yes gene_type:complete